MRNVHTSFGILALTATLLSAPAALAQTDSARASGDLAGGSVEAGARLASTGVTVTAATVVAVSGTGAALVTGDADLVERSLDFAGDLALAPLDNWQEMKVSDTVIVDAPPAPDVPFERRTGRQP